MSSSALRLRTIMNDPSCLDMSREWIELDKHSPPTLLVYGESLANAILKAEGIATYNLVAYWNIVTQAEPPGYPAIESHFGGSPFLLHGAAHRSARKALTHPYRQVEAALDEWLPAFSEAYFDSFPAGQPVSPIQLAYGFIDGAFRGMLAREAGCEASEVPELPSGLFSFLPRKKSVQNFDRQLDGINNFIRQRRAGRGKPAQDDFILSSIVVMGQQPLLGAMVYGLMTPPPDGAAWDSEELMRQSAPVSVLGREAREEMTVQGLKLAKGQPLHICPFLAHMHADAHGAEGAARKSIAFGTGPHVCSGRKISLKITDAFFSQWNNMDHFDLDTSGIRLVRDLLLVPQEKT